MQNNKCLITMNVILSILLTDFKENYELENEIEVVDFYQLICFLLQITPEEHSGSWERIEDMLKISGSPSLSTFKITPFLMMCITSSLIHFY